MALFLRDQAAETSTRSKTIRRILSCNRAFYFDDTSGAAVANRALLEYLVGLGFSVEAVCGTSIDAGLERDPAEILSERGQPFASVEETLFQSGPPRLTLKASGVEVTIRHRNLRRLGDPDATEIEETLRLFDEAVDGFRPDVLLTYGGDELTRDLTRRARSRGIATVFHLHNFLYSRFAPFENIDAVLVPSQFSARYHRAALGLDCTVLPNVVDWKRVRADQPAPKYVTFINPSIEKGVYAFARIADELGRRRPDFPLLVVESRGTEATLVVCGLDLESLGNTHLMSTTSDPRDFWSVTKICLMPSPWWESQGLVAVEAMINGVPVVASDRALPHFA